jgi:hypothetical protein
MKLAGVPAKDPTSDRSGRWIVRRIVKSGGSSIMENLRAEEKKQLGAAVDRILSTHRTKSHR